jgi:beta-galactosidase/beta-glucuronidase
MKRFLLSVAMFTYASIASAAQAPNPTPELDKLDWARGEWTGTLKFSMSGHLTADFTASLKFERETNFLKSTAKFSTEGMEILETAYIGFDPKEKVYKAWTFSNQAPTPRLDKGTITADSMVFVSEPSDAGMGEPMSSRMTMTKKGDKEMVFLLEFLVGDKWEKAAEGTLTKKATTR